MSDEDSGPEEISEDEDKDERIKMWRKDMFKLLGYSGPSKRHEDVDILEVVIPAWRSEIVSTFIFAFCNYSQVFAVEFDPSRPFPDPSLLADTCAKEGCQVSTRSRLSS
jgi:hypothetical protein